MTALKVGWMDDDVARKQYKQAVACQESSKLAELNWMSNSTRVEMNSKGLRGGDG